MPADRFAVMQTSISRADEHTARPKPGPMSSRTTGRRCYRDPALKGKQNYGAKVTDSANSVPLSHSRSGGHDPTDTIQAEHFVPCANSLATDRTRSKRVQRSRPAQEFCLPAGFFSFAKWGKTSVLGRPEPPKEFSALEIPPNSLFGPWAPTLNKCSSGGRVNRLARHIFKFLHAGALAVGSPGN